MSTPARNLVSTLATFTRTVKRAILTGPFVDLAHLQLIRRATRPVLVGGSRNARAARRSFGMNGRARYGSLEIVIGRSILLRGRLDPEGRAGGAIVSSALHTASRVMARVTESDEGARPGGPIRFFVREGFLGTTGRRGAVDPFRQASWIEVRSDENEALASRDAEGLR